MNIAIFGDSYGDDNFSSLKEKSWIDFLKSQRYTIHNFSSSGTSVYWSYNKYLKFKESKLYKSTDKIIFLFTGENRLTVDVLGKEIRLNSPFSCEGYLKYKEDLTEMQIRLINSLNDYFVFIKDLDESKAFCKLMKKEILLDDKVYYTDVFNKSSDPDEVCLFDISSSEVKYLVGIDNNVEFYKNHKDNRKCHMSEPNNLMVGQKILNALLSGQKKFKFYRTDILLPYSKINEYFIKL
jgi:hypothetical protein